MLVIAKWWMFVLGRPRLVPVFIALGGIGVIAANIWYIPLVSTLVIIVSATLLGTGLGPLLLAAIGDRPLAMRHQDQVILKLWRQLRDLPAGARFRDPDTGLFFTIVHHDKLTLLVVTSGSPDDDTAKSTLYCVGFNRHPAPAPMVRHTRTHHRDDTGQFSPELVVDPFDELIGGVETTATEAAEVRAQFTRAQRHPF